MTDAHVARLDYSAVMALVPLPWGALFSVFDLELEDWLERTWRHSLWSAYPLREADIQDLRTAAWEYRSKHKDYYRGIKP